MYLPHYKYRFVQKVYDLGFGDSFFLYKLLYTFKSPKSNLWYWVWVEVYEKDMYVIKFHLKTHRNSKDKYSLMTGLYEARPVIYTCIAIMQEIALNNLHASFGFVGANMEGESERMTKRFKVYSRIMATYFSNDEFKHFMLLQKSAYLLVRKSELAIHPELPSYFDLKFKQLYDYLD